MTTFSRPARSLLHKTNQTSKTDHGARRGENTTTSTTCQERVLLEISGTSTRILLLDTQAHLQKFGQKVDDLTSKVSHAKQEIVTVKTLFQQDREGLMSELVDLCEYSVLIYA